MDKFTNPYADKVPNALYHRPVKLEPQAIERVDLSSLEEKALGLNTDLDIGDTAKAGENIGENALAKAGDIMKFGVGQYNNFTTLSGSSKESTAQTIKSGVEGAALGLQIGGPVGGAVGLVAGVGLGALDAKHDKMVRIDQADQEHRDLLEERKQQRSSDYFLSKGVQSASNEGQARDRQREFINRYA